MKNILLFLLMILIITPLSSYAESSDSDTAYWEQKRLTAQESSTKMRLEYYEKYKSKGYDVSLLTPELLDGKKTEEYKFWDALKKIQNIKEIPERRMYIEKLAKYGADTSGFSEDIIADSGKFWELYKKIESSLSTKKDQSTSEQKLSKQEPIKSEYQKGEEKKNEIKKLPYRDRTVELFISRLDKVPADKLQATLEKLQVNIKKQLENARAKGSKILIKRLEAMLEIVETRLESTDDEALINSLFN